MKQNLCLTFFLMEESMSVGNILCLFFNYFLPFCSPASFRKKGKFLWGSSNATAHNGQEYTIIPGD